LTGGYEKTAVTCVTAGLVPPVTRGRQGNRGRRADPGTSLHLDHSTTSISSTTLL